MKDYPFEVGRLYQVNNSSGIGLLATTARPDTIHRFRTLENGELFMSLCVVERLDRPDWYNILVVCKHGMGWMLCSAYMSSTGSAGREKYFAKQLA